MLFCIGVFICSGAILTSNPDAPSGLLEFLPCQERQMPKKCFSLFFLCGVVCACLVLVGFFVVWGGVVFYFFFSGFTHCSTVILGLKDIAQEESGYAKLYSQFCVIRKTETVQNKPLRLTLGALKFCIKMWSMFLEQVAIKGLFCGCRAAVWTRQDIGPKSDWNYG